ncbi:MAG: hypothetical protein A2172_01615 [Candidatus Woykebacteria bacterium RBG_13_40_15]|uniref:Uncharacterized protein n=1 Tax=Candidatus Woykebacteria bacterium RBG_13_40_15 TaxID=1802593 RepID=A0A1G1W554_9BACT|nr:MAG: hypothetical protein A2172_01615 [Candidatus Woykebacteria bacterium RBG_13_40_15]
MATLVGRWQAQGCISFPYEDGVIESTFRRLGYRDTLYAMINQNHHPEIGSYTVDWARPIDESVGRYPRFHLEICKVGLLGNKGSGLVMVEIRVHVDERPHVTPKTESAGLTCLREVERIEKEYPKLAN